MTKSTSCVIDGIRCEIFFKYPERCALCYEHSLFLPEKQKNKSQPMRKKSNRLGARFEEENHKKNQVLLKTESFMTPNSGAGTVKGDEQISGIINIMEELKTKVKAKISRGSKTFTIHKDWLEKLTREASLENKEFWYLKFKFLESDNDTYIVVDQEIIMSMVKTMVMDRKRSLNADSSINVYKLKNRELEAKLVAAASEIKTLQSQIDCLRKQQPLEDNILID